MKFYLLNFDVNESINYLSRNNFLLSARLKIHYFIGDVDDVYTSLEECALGSLPQQIYRPTIPLHNGEDWIFVMKFYLLNFDVNKSKNYPSSNDFLLYA